MRDPYTHPAAICASKLPLPYQPPHGLLVRSVIDDAPHIVKVAHRRDGESYVRLSTDSVHTRPYPWRFVRDSGLYRLDRGPA